MSAVDKYVDSSMSGNQATALLKALSSADGSKLRALFATFEVASTDSSGSVYRAFKSVDPNFIPLAVLIGCDAVTGCTDNDLGLYKPDLGAVIGNGNVFMDGQTFASALDLGFATAIDGMDNVDIADYGKRLFELAGHTEITKLGAYDIAITANALSSSSGTVSILILGVSG